MNSFYKFIIISSFLIFLVVINNNNNRKLKLNTISENNKYTQLIVDQGDSFIYTENSEQPIKCNGFGKISCWNALHKSSCYKSIDCYQRNVKCETITIKPTQYYIFKKNIYRNTFMNLYIESDDTSTLNIDVATGSNIQKIADGELAFTKKIGKMKNLLCKHFSSSKYYIANGDDEELGLVIKCNNILQPCAFYIKYELV